MKQLFFLLSILLSTSSWAQDTLGVYIDTTLCRNIEDQSYFESHRDTSVFNSEWVVSDQDTILSGNILIALGDSILISPDDSIILISTYKDTSIPNLFIDTFSIDLRFRPDTNFIIPTVECYNNMPLEITDNTNYYNSAIQPSFMDQDGNSYTSDADNIVAVSVGNGDSTTINYNYEDQVCGYVIDKSFSIGTLLQPLANLNYELTCENELLIINNNSSDTKIQSQFTIELDGTTIDYDNDSTFEWPNVLEDGVYPTTIYLDNLNGCVDTIIDMVSIERVPIAAFDFTKTCENELLEFINNSTETLPQTMYSFDINGQIINNFNLIDTLADETYSVFAIVDNNNGCSDTTEFEVVIDSVTYVSFSGLDAEYCGNQDIDTLIADIPGGNFAGTYTNEIGNGMAKFQPIMPASNIVIQYTFTNGLGCTDVAMQIVDTIYARPEIELLVPLESEYCELDPDVELAINQNIVSNSVYDIFRNGLNYDFSTGLDYTFVLDSPGSFTFINRYEDENGCRDTLISNTIVNPLPQIELDSLIIITPGEIIEIGPNALSDVSYFWSNGDNNSIIEVDQPGAYILFATNIITTCENTDTIRIEFDPTIESDLLNVSIAPNPTSSFVDVQFDNQVSNILLINIFGTEVSLNGQSEFSTDNNGLLTLDLSSLNTGYYYLIVPNYGNFLLLKN